MSSRERDYQYPVRSVMRPEQILAPGSFADRRFLTSNCGLFAHLDGALRAVSRDDGAGAGRLPAGLGFGDLRRTPDPAV